MTGPARSTLLLSRGRDSVRSLSRQLAEVEMSGRTNTLGSLNDRPDQVQANEDAPRDQPDIVVQWLAWSLSEIQVAVSWVAYERLARKWKARGCPSLYFNYVYALGWAGILLVLIVLTALLPGFAIAAAAIASYRFAEVAVWYVKLLFDSSHQLILSPERNLLFLTIDSAATVVIVGLWLAAVPGDGSKSISEWRAALETFTLNGTPRVSRDGSPGWQWWPAHSADFC
jgi:hypothetical protein